MAGLGLFQVRAALSSKACVVQRHSIRPSGQVPFDTTSTLTSQGAIADLKRLAMLSTASLHYACLDAMVGPWPLLWLHIAHCFVPWHGLASAPVPPGWACVLSICSLKLSCDCSCL